MHIFNLRSLVSAAAVYLDVLFPRPTHRHPLRRPLLESALYIVAVGWNSGPLSHRQLDFPPSRPNAQPTSGERVPSASQTRTASPQCPTSTYVEVLIKSPNNTAGSGPPHPRPPQLEKRRRMVEERHGSQATTTWDGDSPYRASWASTASHALTHPDTQHVSLQFWVIVRRRGHGSHLLGDSPPCPDANKLGLTRSLCAHILFATEANPLYHPVTLLEKCSVTLGSLGLKVDPLLEGASVQASDWIDQLEGTVGDVHGAFTRGLSLHGAGCGQRTEGWILVDLPPLQSDSALPWFLHMRRWYCGNAQALSSAPIASGAKDDLEAGEAEMDWTGGTNRDQRRSARMESIHPGIQSSTAKGVGHGREIEETWKPNPTLFDNSATEHWKFSHNGYPVISSSPFDILRFYLDAAIYLPEVPNKLTLDTSAFAIMLQFFRLATQGMDELEDDLTVEFVAHDVTAGIAKLVNGDLGPRPAHFPKKFLRMWLNNVPDYTSGPLGSVVHLVPYLQESKYSMTLSNCLLNCSSFANLNELCFNYTYCHADDMKDIFGVLYRDEKGTTFDEMNISVIQRKSLFSSTVSKKKLHDYLKLMFIRFLCPPRSPQMPFRIDEPGTLAYFHHLLFYLVQHAGCPAHWVAEVLQSIVDDKLVTDVIPYTGMLPIQPAAKNLRTASPRKVNLKPWRAELETILVSIKPMIPFSIILLEDIASLTHKDIGTYTAGITSTVENRFDISPFVKTAGLVFYPPSAAESDVSRVVARKVDLLDDLKGTLPQVQFLSMQEGLDVKKGVVSWRMRKGWYKRMVKEGWKMMVYVSNQAVTVTRPVDARMWMEA
ncbi:hypothetical protein NMY22_g4929 [Coprinellus aureogranulatus]|nr:hypothetical protein NMY22_g4929 [Coprinellus aureogranulatus]